MTQLLQIWKLWQREPLDIELTPTLTTACISTLPWRWHHCVWHPHHSTPPDLAATTNFIARLGLTKSSFLGSKIHLPQDVSIVQESIVRCIFLNPCPRSRWCLLPWSACDGVRQGLQDLNSLIVFKLMNYMEFLHNLDACVFYGYWSLMKVYSRSWICSKVVG
jgi:hypothetical protein